MTRDELLALHDFTTEPDIDGSGEESLCGYVWIAGNRMGSRVSGSSPEDMTERLREQAWKTLTNYAAALTKVAQHITVEHRPVRPLSHGHYRFAGAGFPGVAVFDSTREAQPYAVPYGRAPESDVVPIPQDVPEATLVAASKRGEDG